MSDHYNNPEGKPAEEPKEEQLAFFSVRANPSTDEAWGGMPEFTQEDLSPTKSLLVHFASWEDYEAFAELIGQRLGPKTQSVWHPIAEVGTFVDKKYVDEGTGDSE